MIGISKPTIDRNVRKALEKKKHKSAYQNMEDSGEDIPKYIPT